MKRFLYLVSGFFGFIKLTGKDRKSAGEWGFLSSMLFIVPLLFWEHPGVIVSVVLQLLWAAVGHDPLFWPAKRGRKTNKNPDPLCNRFSKRST